MLLFQNGRFYAQYISFVLPEGCYLDTDPPVANTYGINAWVKSHDIEMDLCEEDADSNCDLKESMQSYLFSSPDGFERDSDIVEIAVNGVTGYEVLYHDKSTDYYEIWFKLPDDKTATFFAQCPKGQVENLKTFPMVQKFIASIQREW